MKEIFELAEKIGGTGSTGFFYRLKSHPRLGVKILILENKKSLIKELNTGKRLRKMGISVPKYLSIINVKYESETRSGLLMQLIDSDLKMNVLDEKNELIQIELNKCKKLGIKPYEYDKGRNVLWSKKRNKIYFIDPVVWDLPPETFKEKIQKILRL